jgi:soluble lytic murein transglycosylase
MGRAWVAVAAWLSAGVLAWGATEGDEPSSEDVAEQQVARTLRAARRGADLEPRVARAIVREADRNGLDPLLVAAVIYQESAFNRTARSHAGALGLMQLMPVTGHHLMEGKGRKLEGEHHLLDVDLNVELGTSYLRHLILQFGSLPEALLAYNHGPAGARQILRDRARRERVLAGYPRRVMDSWASFKAHGDKLGEAEPARTR